MTKLRNRLIPVTYFYEKEMYDRAMYLDNRNSDGLYVPGFWRDCKGVILVRKELPVVKKYYVFFHEIGHHIIDIVFGWNKILVDFVNFTHDVINVVVSELFLGLPPRVTKRIKRYYIKKYGRKK